MDREELYRIARDAVREEELTGDEIPAIDLYVDQIINLVSDKLRTGSERYRDRQLTKTMINNYSKDGLIAPIKGKKYNKEQIIQILTVYTLKNTLSIGQIKRLLDGAYSIEGFDGEALTEVYDRHLEIKRSNRDYTLEILDGLMERQGLDTDDEREFMLLVGSLLSLSAFLRQTAQAMIDVKYPIPAEVEEKKEEKKSARKEKETAKSRKKREPDASAASDSKSAEAEDAEG